MRAAAPDTLIITDGFSCREQIAQLADRRALHLAEVLAMALPGAVDRRRGTTPRGSAPGRCAGGNRRSTMAGAAALLAGAIGFGSLMGRR